MAAELVIAPEAELDLLQAYGWYEDQRVGLGEAFLSKVDACIQSVRRSPEIHAPVLNNYRRALVRRFPFTVFYEYENETVTVDCVFHTSRDPDKWRRRLRGSG
jgi:plasmid stabilization system protein ParE